MISSLHDGLSILISRSCLPHIMSKALCKSLTVLVDTCPGTCPDSFIFRWHYSFIKETMYNVSKKHGLLSSIIIHRCF